MVSYFSTTEAYRVSWPLKRVHPVVVGIDVGHLQVRFLEHLWIKYCIAKTPKELANIVKD